MITKYDLRIGNYLESDGRDMIITGHYLSNVERGTQIDNPIPITEEWLLAFGCEKAHECDKYTNYIYDIEVGEMIVKKRKGFYYLYNYNKILKLQYVHEWQNIHFSITKKELEFTKS